MKTVTRTFYVPNDFIDKLKRNKINDICDEKGDLSYFSEKIEISWEQPEKEFRVSMSEFDKAVQSSINHVAFYNNESFIETLRKNLFGNREG